MRWEESTCLEFQEFSNKNVKSHYLRFIRGNGCWSSVGFDSRVKYQDVSIGEGCFKVINNSNIYIYVVSLLITIFVSTERYHSSRDWTRSRFISRTVKTG